MMATKNLDDVSKKLILGQKTAFLAQKPAFVYATPIQPPFFGLGRTRLNGIITSPHPEVTLDNFGFPVGGRSAAQRAVFWPPGRILAIFDDGRLLEESTPNFGPRSMKLGWNTRGTKKMIWGTNGAGPDRIYGETTVFAFSLNAKNGPKIRFLL